MIELVAITDDPAPPQPPLRSVGAGGLHALCAPAEAAEVTPETLWRRQELLEELMRDRDLLPVRFGTLVPDEAAAVRALDERRDELTAGLERVRGAVEVAVRAQPPEPEPVTDAPAGGRAYLEQRIGRARAARAVHEPLAALARAAAVQHGHELLRAAYLVEREAVPAFVAAVREQQAAHPELAILCTGPWPPFSFAEGSAS